MISVCAIIKNEHRYIEEWLNYHIKSGVEKFFIYDNDDENPHRSILLPYIREGSVIYTEHFTSRPNRQADAHSDCIERLQASGKGSWCVFIDTDEFIAGEQSLPELIQEAEDGGYDKIQLKWSLFGCSGHVKSPDGNVVDNYTANCRMHPKIGYDYKTILKIADSARVANIHFIQSGGAVLCADENRIRLNHYITKSWDDWRAKINRGSITKGLYNLLDFFIYNPEMRRKIQDDSQAFGDILIVGFGNIGRHIYKEFEPLKPDIYDPNIPEYNQSDGKFYNYAFICVPTDAKEDGSCDISIVERTVSETAADLIIIKSTVTPGTTDDLIRKNNHKSIVFSPEYYGVTQHSPDSPGFLVLGGGKAACVKAAQLYYRVKNGSFKIHFTDARTAELAKYMLNSFLAMKVTFCAEFAEMAASLRIPYEELREIFVLDERVGNSHTFVYRDKPYYDSHCFNKDIPALLHKAVETGCEMPLLAEMHRINDAKKSK